MITSIFKPLRPSPRSRTQAALGHRWLPALGDVIGRGRHRLDSRGSASTAAATDLAAAYGATDAELARLRRAPAWRSPEEVRWNVESAVWYGIYRPR